IPPPLTDAVEQALVMDSIEELGQIEIHDRPVAGCKMLLCLGDGRHRTAPRAEPVAAVMKGRLQHRETGRAAVLLPRPCQSHGRPRPPAPRAGASEAPPDGHRRAGSILPAA